MKKSQYFAKCKYHYIYKITNLITGHYYIGAHSASDLFDGYMGSGVFIKKAIRHYGINNFEKVIIKNCKSVKEKWFWERKLLTEKVIKDPNCYNLITGGKYRNGKKKVKAKTKNFKELMK